MSEITMGEAKIEDYRMAGELFCRIESKLPDGELSMISRHRVFIYRWDVKDTTGQWFGSQHAVSMIELRARMFPLATLADQIVSTWTHHHGIDDIKS